MAAFCLIQALAQHRPPNYLHEVDNSNADSFYIDYEELPKDLNSLL
jgi:hypothetical protein